MQETACDRIVASAAPLTPRWNAKINSGSRTMFITAPIRTESIPVLAKPCVVINIFMPRGKLDENSADSVNVHIIYSVFNRIFTGTEGKKKSTVTKQQDDCQDYRNPESAGKAVTRICSAVLRSFFPIAIEACGAPPPPTSAAKAEMIIISGIHTPTPVRGKCPITRNVSDVNTVNNVVQHIDELCGDRRKCQPEHQLSDGFSTQKIFCLCSCLIISLCDK